MDEIDKVDDVAADEDLSTLDDTTDWKAKAQEIEQKRREDGIRSRERTKSLREQLAANKSQEKPQDKKEDSKPEVPALLQKSFLRAAGITAQDEVDLALTTAKKWGIEVDQLVDDEDFIAKLDKLRTQKSNALATSNIKGGSGSQQAKNTPEFWIAKGAPPSASDIPDRKTRAKIARAMMANAKNGKTFYND